MAAVEVDTPGSFLLYGSFRRIYFKQYYLFLVWVLCFAAFRGVPVTGTRPRATAPPAGNDPARERGTVRGQRGSAENGESEEKGGRGDRPEKVRGERENWPGAVRGESGPAWPGPEAGPEPRRSGGAEGSQSSPGEARSELPAEPFPSVPPTCDRAPVPCGPLCPPSGLPSLQEFLGCASPSVLGVCAQGAPAQRPVPAEAHTHTGYPAAEGFFPELPLTLGLGTCSPLGSSSDLLE